MLCELEWVLVSRYKVLRTEVAAAVQRLLDNAVFVFEDRSILLQAITGNRQSRAGSLIT